MSMSLFPPHRPQFLQPVTPPLTQFAIFSKLKVCVYMYAFMRVCKFICTCMHIYMYIWVCMCVYIYMYMYIHMYMHIYMHMHNICTCWFFCRRTGVYTYVNTHAYAYLFKYIPVHESLSLLAYPAPMFSFSQLLGPYESIRTCMYECVHRWKQTMRKHTCT